MKIFVRYGHIKIPKVENDKKVIDDFNCEYKLKPTETLQLYLKLFFKVKL